MKDACGESVRKHRGVHLGFVSQMTKSALVEKLQKIIYQETGQGVGSSDKVTPAWFWDNRLLVARRGDRSDATLKGNLTDWSHYNRARAGSIETR